MGRVPCVGSPVKKHAESQESFKRELQSVNRHGSINQEKREKKKNGKRRVRRRRMGVHGGEGEEE